MHAGFRERLMGDPSFPVKVAIECGIGVVTKASVVVCGFGMLIRTLQGGSRWSPLRVMPAVLQPALHAVISMQQPP
jgi:hypothetical protein